MVRAAMAALVIAMAAPAVAQAGPTSPTTAIVSLGDSFISGEAGRWNGNSLNSSGPATGPTARHDCTWWDCSYDGHRVYGSSYNNDCHRSDVAPIKSAAISVNEKINIACSGARTEQHLARVTGWAGVQGRGAAGRSAATDRPAEEREAGRADDLRQRPRLHRPRDRLHRRLDDELADDPDTASPRSRPRSQPRCRRRATGLAQGDRRDARGDVDSRLLAVPVAVRHAGLRVADPDRRQHPLPGVGLVRLTGAAARSTTRTRTGQRTRRRPTSSTTCATSAPRRACGSSTCADALNGHEVCHSSASLVGARRTVGDQHEWVRWINSGCCQGDAQESLHPNAYGAAGDRQVHRADLRGRERATAPAATPPGRGWGR